MNGFSTTIPRMEASYEVVRRDGRPISTGIPRGFDYGSMRRGFTGVARRISSVQHARGFWLEAVGKYSQMNLTRE
jgi:hypothetical protein